MGWITDDMHHVVIGETGVPQAEGRIRYPSEAPGHVEFPSEVAAGEAWEGWIDGLNIGGGTGQFCWYISSTSGCNGDLGIVPEPPNTITLDPGYYTVLKLTGAGPADFWICFMRYVP